MLEALGEENFNNDDLLGKSTQYNADQSDENEEIDGRDTENNNDDERDEFSNDVVEDSYEAALQDERNASNSVAISKTSSNRKSSNAAPNGHQHENNNGSDDDDGDDDYDDLGYVTDELPGTHRDLPFEKYGKNHSKQRTSAPSDKLVASSSSSSFSSSTTKATATAATAASLSSMPIEPLSSKASSAALKTKSLSSTDEPKRKDKSGVAGDKALKKAKSPLVSGLKFPSYLTKKRKGN